MEKTKIKSEILEKESLIKDLKNYKDELCNLRVDVEDLTNEEIKLIKNFILKKINNCNV